MTEVAEWVTACIPTFRCRPYLRQAVDSLLGQSYPYLRIIVINDGDPEQPWDVLADIDDPRLFRFELGENRGPYFCLAVCLKATPDRLFLIQDADDVSDPTRAEILLRLLEHDRSIFAFSSNTRFLARTLGQPVVEKRLFVSQPRRFITPHFREYLIPHWGLFRTDALHALGGYFAGFPFGYDLLLTKLISLVGPVSWTPENLYWVRRRGDSLTQSLNTGYESPMRRNLNDQMERIYNVAYQQYLAYRAGDLTHEQLVGRIRALIEKARGRRQSVAIQQHALRLQKGLADHYRYFAAQH